ncbi:Multivesicular body subunit 12B [Liparis tanakae]|uniref:Multivesicular body subunit 12B n=1 Tax=Liparis tanakae TaxID=230148 RepID=A0A4Z2J9Z2_9TELE|nr:Multivesicular body subunit 12B [Liparis tanakae]
MTGEAVQREAIGRLLSPTVMDLNRTAGIDEITKQRVQRASSSARARGGGERGGAGIVSCSCTDQNRSQVSRYLRGTGGHMTRSPVLKAALCPSAASQSTERGSGLLLRLALQSCRGRRSEAKKLNKLPCGHECEALDDVPFVITEKFYENPKEMQQVNLMGITIKSLAEIEEEVSRGCNARLPLTPLAQNAKQTFYYNFTTELSVACRAVLTVSSSQGGQRGTEKQPHHTQTGTADVHFPAEASIHHKVHHERRAAPASSFETQEPLATDAHPRGLHFDVFVMARAQLAPDPLGPCPVSVRPVVGMAVPQHSVEFDIKPFGLEERRELSSTDRCTDPVHL